MEIKQEFICDPGLVLYLPLHKLDGACFMSRDACGQLCLATGALWTPQGRCFDGIDDDINCGAGSSLNITGSYTIEAWINLSQLGVLQNIVVKTNLQYYLRNSNILASTFYDGIAWRETIGTTVLNTDRWYHTAGTHRDGEQRLYLDSLTEPLSGGGTYSTGPTSDINSLYVGKDGGGVQHWKGLIGEVRIYNRALSSPEIQRIYLTTKWRYQ